MPLSSDLPEVTSLTGNDVVMVVKNPDGAAQTSIITVDNFVLSMAVDNAEWLVTAAANVVFVANTHHDKMLAMTLAANGTLTVKGDNGVGTKVSLTQLGAGQISIVAANGATVVSYSGDETTRGEYDVMSAYVRSNADDLSAVWVVYGGPASL